jgi:hypothetical protein
MSNVECTQFVILSCDTYINSRIRTIESTWAKDTNHIFLVDTNVNEKNIIGYNTPKNYEGIQDKYREFFKCYDFSKYDYYFFTDDDTFVNIENFNKINIDNPDKAFGIGSVIHLLKKSIENNQEVDPWYISRISGINTGLPLSYFSGGSGFILSKESCNRIKKYLLPLGDTDIPISPWGDVSIGFWARSCGIELKNSGQFFWNTHEYLLENFEDYPGDKNAVTFHYVDMDTLVRYDLKYNMCKQ